MKTPSEQYNRRIEELEEKLRKLEIKDKNYKWSPGTVFKFITLGCVTVVGAGVILQQHRQLESQKEAITFLFDKLKEAHGEQTENSLKLLALQDSLTNLKAEYEQHQHQYDVWNESWITSSVSEKCGTPWRHRKCN